MTDTKSCDLPSVDIRASPQRMNTPHRETSQIFFFKLLPYNVFPGDTIAKTAVSNGLSVATIDSTGQNTSCCFFCHLV